MRAAASGRVFGFEIMPAPFVVAHMQAGMTLAQMQAPLSADARPAIYLTNALTGWEPHTNKPLPFPELEEERASADAVKQTRPILVVLGNPPYDGYAGVSDNAEERALSDEYRKVDKVAPPQGQGLNELYVRFFRMAERRIAERTGEGVVAFISNYGWLDSMSCTGMRERYLDVFDSISIDCLNGDKFKTGKKTPEGLPDPSIFSMPANPVGIQVGTAICTMVRKREHEPAGGIGFRHLWGGGKREVLAQTAEADPATLYEAMEPSLKMRLQFMPSDVEAGYFEWPALPDLLPVGFAGVKTSRDEFLVDVDRGALEKRIARYLDPKVSDADIARSHPMLAKAVGGFGGLKARASLLARHMAEDERSERTKEPVVRAGSILPYVYRPFDVRWLYWDPDYKLLDRERAEFIPHAAQGAILLEAREKEVGDTFTRGAIAGGLADNFGNGLSTFFPAMLDDGHGALQRPNLKQTMDVWRAKHGLAVTDIFFHCVATIHAPGYRRDYGDALRAGWPRIPLTNDADALRASAALGEQVGALLNAQNDVAGVSVGALRDGLSMISLPRGQDFAVTLGWGYIQLNKTGSRIVMPGGGRTVTRAWTDAERNGLTALAARHEIDASVLLELIGTTAVDVHINGESRWEGVPSKVWAYELGGHQVLKKWLSYREADLFGRALTGDEVLQFSRIVRRITEVLCMGPKLDAAHATCRLTATEL
jgi:predicted helicase